MKITMIKVGGDTVSILIDTTKKHVEEEKRILRGMYPKEHIKVKEINWGKK